MANAQIKFLNKRDEALKAILVAEIQKILNQHSGVFFSSHEITNLLSSISLAQLKLLISNYSGSGFAEPASFIGSLSSELAKQGVLIHGQKRCPVLNKLEAAFAV